MLASIATSASGRSRLDLPPGSDPRHEPDTVGDPPTGHSHVRKSGSRLPVHMGMGIFRRGVPYLEIQPDGSLHGGLQFVSFQRSLELFELVLARWLRNADFPTPGTGLDRLFAEGFATIRRSGVFVVPPGDRRHIGAGLFDPDARPGRRRRPGHVLIRKRVVDANGAASPADRAGVGFRVYRADTREPIGDVFRTDGLGHATSPAIPLGTTVVVREEEIPAHLTPADSTEQTVVVDGRAVVVRFTNRLQGGYR